MGAWALQAIMYQFLCTRTTFGDKKTCVMMIMDYLCSRYRPF